MPYTSDKQTSRLTERRMVMVHSEMTFKELVKEEYIFRWYQAFLANAALRKRVPFEIQLYKSGKKRESMIIYMSDENNDTFSRKISGSKYDMLMLRSWLEGDFPEVELHLVNYPEMEALYAEHEANKEPYRDD